MFVYIWKRPDGTPFYVGCSKSIRRTDPTASGGRGWLCRQALAEIGPFNVIVELHRVGSMEEGSKLEQHYIALFGRIQLGTGPLTNLRIGGDGLSKNMSEAGMETHRRRMVENNPMKDPAIRAKATERLKRVMQQYTGNNNPAKRPEVREKIKAKWADPEFRAMMKKVRTGKPRKFSASHLQSLREKVLDPSGPFANAHIKLNTDPLTREKRIAALRTEDVKAKISAGNKKAWANKSPEARAAQARGLTAPKSDETRRKISEAAKLRWAKRRNAIT